MKTNEIIDPEAKPVDVKIVPPTACIVTSDERLMSDNRLVDPPLLAKVVRDFVWRCPA